MHPNEHSQLAKEPAFSKDIQAGISVSWGTGKHSGAKSPYSSKAVFTLCSHDMNLGLSLQSTASALPTSSLSQVLVG